jgi:hypothetical protein
MLNQTRAHPGIARESKFQGPGISLRPSCIAITGLADLSGKRRQAHHFNVAHSAGEDARTKKPRRKSGASCLWGLPRGWQTHGHHTTVGCAAQETSQHAQKAPPEERGSGRSIVSRQRACRRAEPASRADDTGSSIGGATDETPIRAVGFYVGTPTHKPSARAQEKPRQGSGAQVG